MAFDAFLKIDGIDGGSTDQQYLKWIDVLSFSWGVNNAGSIVAAGSGGGAGKVHVHDFSFTKSTDVASPKLFTSAAQGSHFQKAVLTCRKAGADGAVSEFLKITFSDILIASFVDGGHVTDDTPLDQVSLSFQKADLQVLDSSGTITPGA